MKITIKRGCANEHSVTLSEIAIQEAPDAASQVIICKRNAEFVHPQTKEKLHPFYLFSYYKDQDQRPLRILRMIFYDDGSHEVFQKCKPVLSHT